MSRSDRAPAVRRAIAALTLVAQRGAATPVELARELGLAKSSASDLVRTMLAEGLLARRSDELTVGPLLGELTAGFVGDETVLSRFAALWAREPVLGEHTVSVQSLVGTQSFCVDVRLGRYLLPYTPRAGSRTDAWDGTTGEPILRSLTADAVKDALRAFSGFDALDHDAALLDWVDRCSRGNQPDPLPAATGNLELNVAVTPPRSDAPPVVLSLHLPPRWAGRPAAELRAALADLAEAVRG